jgi:hypothetical protein
MRFDLFRSEQVNQERKPTPPWVRHGALRVADSGRRLEFMDGTGFFWLGDTPWSLVELSPTLIDTYLADRASRGFTVIHMNATNFGRANFAGEFPFAGEGPPWSTATLNAPYWQHVDMIVERAAQHGLYVLLLALWGHHAHFPYPSFWKQPIGHYIGEFFHNPATENERFGTLLGARYRHAPNMIWCAAGEYHNPYNDVPMAAEHRTRLEQIALSIRRGDQGCHLMSIHPMAYKSSSDDFHDAPWLDFNMIQTHKRTDYIDHLLIDDWYRAPTKPTLLVEGRYEQPGSDNSWLQRYQAYWAVLHGSLGYGYGHELLWRLADETGHTGCLVPELLASSGARSMAHLAGLIAQLPGGNHVPAPDLIMLNWRGSDAGSPLGAVPGLVCAVSNRQRDWVLIYSTCGHGFEVRLDLLAKGVLNAYWYNPRTGSWHCDGAESPVRRPFATQIRCGGACAPCFFAPPGVPAADNDWVLLLAAAL